MKTYGQAILLSVVTLIIVGLGFSLIQSWSRSEGLGNRVRNLEMQAVVTDQRETLNSPTPVSQDYDSDALWQVSQHGKQIQLLTEQLTQLTSQLARLEQSVLDLDTDSPQTEIKQPEALRKTREEYKAEAQQRVAEKQRQTLDQFYAEPVDEIWSQSTQIELEQRFISELQGGAEMTYVECHSASCEARWRLNQSLPDEKKFEYDNAVLEQVAKAGFDSAVYLEPLDVGEYRVILKKSQPQPATK